MSERSSFTTEFIECAICAENIEKALCRDDKYLKAVRIPHWGGLSDRKLPIIAGKVGASYCGGEISTLREYLQEAKYSSCHDVKIALILDSGDLEGAVVKKDGWIERCALQETVQDSIPDRFPYEIDEYSSWETAMSVEKAIKILSKVRPDMKIVLSGRRENNWLQMIEVGEENYIRFWGVNLISKNEIRNEDKNV